MNKVENYYQEMLEMLQAGIDDVEKFAEGNKSAGTRVRKTMQDVKNLAQVIRVEVQEQKNTVAA
ncbi:hypothetical protein N9D80_01310 [Flavobacteriales bacterium]|jgi:hypothetical protein|nr:hypothetical protein [Flavobacteriales bacterium]